MTKSKLNKYVGKNVKIYYRHKLKSDVGIIKYRPNEPLWDYFLYQPQHSVGFVMSYIALSHKLIGHIKILRGNGQ